MATGYLDNYYARLGIPHTATQEEIRNAYHLAARKFHPDYNKDKSAVEVFLQIQEAYETLSNATARINYDRLLPEDIRTPKDILVNAIYSRQSLTNIDRPQLLYVLLNIVALQNPNNTVARQPLNICIVLDNSNSMSGSRLNAVKSTANQIIQALRPEDILSVVTFNDRAEVIIPATRNQNLNVLTAKISQIYPGGGTEIFQGLDTGYQELKNTGGNSEFAETTNGIQTFLKEKFGRIQNTVVNNLTLDINTPENIELRYAFRMNPETSSIMLGDTLALGDIPKEQSLSVLMEFLIESTGNQQEVQVLDGTLHLMMPSAPIPNFSSRLTFSRLVVENPEPVPPPQILIRAMSRLSLYRLQEMARKDMQNGDITKATQRLKNLATQLLMSGEENLAQTVMLELDHINRNQEMSENAQKQIKYGTRALVLDDF
ncbi:MAG: DnaJ domain-containing protein [Anaerolineales bacterium]